MQRMTMEEFKKKLLSLFEKERKVEFIINGKEKYIILKKPLRVNVKDRNEDCQMIFAVTKKLRATREYELELADCYVTLEGAIDEIVSRTLKEKDLKNYEFDIELIDNSEMWLPAEVRATIIV